METIYYSLDAKRLTICADAQGCRASGGTESVCYAFVPRRVSTQRPAQAKVVNLSLIHIPSPRDGLLSRMPSSA